MSVTVGSARIDEDGNAHGGAAGDQTGKELSTQAWYKHSKGWRVLRAKDAQVAEKIAVCMERACANSNIGYDQYQRDTLYKVALKVGFDCGKVQEKCETDCSALVRVCMAYAGVTVQNFRTTDQAKIMLASGAFDEMTGAEYTDNERLLRRGDVLVTRTQGHTVVVLTDGDGVEKPHELGSRILRLGSVGDDVAQLQDNLAAIGYTVTDERGKYAASTHAAVVAYQQKVGLVADGEYGPLTHTAMLNTLANTAPAPAQPTPGVRYAVTGNTVWLYDNHPDFGGNRIGVAGMFDTLTGLNTRGYVPVVIDGKIRWISSKYLKEV